MFAKRYKDVPSSRLSFDLVNEPLELDVITREEHKRAISAAVRAIRAVSPDRLIVADGMGGGNIPCPELAELHIAQSCRAYQPMTLTLHRVVLDWMSDVMDVLQGYNIGYALWNFRGQFGILDSQCKDCRYEDWRGHLLDRQMLEILKAH